MVGEEAVAVVGGGLRQLWAAGLEEGPWVVANAGTIVRGGEREEGGEKERKGEKERERVSYDCVGE